MGLKSSSDAEIEDLVAKMANGIKGALNSAEIDAAAEDDEKEFSKHLEREKKLVQLEAERDNLDANRDHRELRILYSSRFFGLGIAWLLVVVVVVIAQGFGSIHGWFWLSDKVLIALLAATSTIFGLLTVWAAWLFPSTSKASKPTRRLAPKK